MSPWQIFSLELELKTKGLSSSVNFLRRHVTKNGIFTQAPHSTCNILICVSNVLTSLENNITQNLLIVLVHREWMMIIQARIFREAYYIKHQTPFPQQQIGLKSCREFCLFFQVLLFVLSLHCYWQWWYSSYQNITPSFANRCLNLDIMNILGLPFIL